MAYHEQQNGQSKETFRLIGGRHVRADGTTIMRGDTCHITQREAQIFGDKFELVLPTRASDMDITVEDSVARKSDEYEEVDVSAATGQAEITRDDFSSQKAFDFWEKNGSLDLSGVQRTGHAGRTYSLADVKKATA